MMDYINYIFEFKNNILKRFRDFYEAFDEFSEFCIENRIHL